MAVVVVDTKYENDKVKLIPLSSRAGGGLAIGLLDTYGFHYVEVYLSPGDIGVLRAELGIYLRGLEDA